ncbi:nuclear RNA export factor 3 isoform X2 [Crocuta crocuta]
MGRNNACSSLQRSARCWGIYRRRHNNWPGHVRSGTDPSSHQQQDGDPATNDTHMSTRGRYTPYAIPSRHQRGNFQIQDQAQANMKGEQKPPERRMEGKGQDETSRSWFKIIIPFGIRYDEKWLLNLIQKQCSISFTPVEFHYEKMQAQFFVENADIAFALKSVNGTIWDENNEMISVFVHPSDAPQSVQKELKPEKVDQIKLLPSNLRDKKPYQLDGLSNTMQNASSIKDLNLSNSESAGELDKGKRLQPEEMGADRNPLCTTFPDKSTNISSILELFPKLLCLDGQESPSPTSVGIAAQKRLPTCKGSFFGSDALKSLVLQFLQQSSLCEYLKENRNMKKIKDPYLRVQLLKHTKHDVVHSLCVLPKTQHDLSSFVVDIWFQMEMMLCFSVNGVFKEVEGMSQDSLRAFTRTFIANPVSNYSLCILNDTLLVRDIRPKGTQSTCSIQVPTPSCSYSTTFSQKQQGMVQFFTT